MDKLRQLEREATAAASEIGPEGPCHRIALIVILANQIRQELEGMVLGTPPSAHGDRRRQRDPNFAVERRRYVTA